jgi:hypothetical protein
VVDNGFKSRLAKPKTIKLSLADSPILFINNMNTVTYICFTYNDLQKEKKKKRMRMRE